MLADSEHSPLHPRSAVIDQQAHGSLMPLPEPLLSASSQPGPLLTTEPWQSPASAKRG
jgi:hypothetical protein